MVDDTNNINTNNNNNKYAHLPLVPEVTLKKRHDLDALARKRAAALEGATDSQKRRRQHQQRGSGGGGGRQLPNGKKAVYVMKPETLISRARSRRNHAIRMNRVLRKGMQKRASNKPIMATKEVVDPNDPSQVVQVPYQANSVGTKHCVFVIRIRDNEGLPRSTRMVLKELRLNHKHDGVFVSYDDETRKKLHLIEPWVIYGIPSSAVVTDLITRRGFGTCLASTASDNNNNNTKDKSTKNNNERIPLSDNLMVEQALGETHGLICVKDLIHEIYHVGPAFAAAAQFLWPFRLGDSKSEFQRKVLRLKDGKQYGDQGEAMDDFIQQVL